MKDIQTPIEVEKDDSFKTLLSKFGCIALDRQENLSELIHDMEGVLDLETGILKFNEDLEFPVQFLGFYSGRLGEDQRDEFGQWSWCWDNEDIGFDEKFIEAVSKIKQIGEENNIDLFTTPILETDYNNCHSLVMTICGILDMDAYYAARVGDFDVFVAIKSDLIKRVDTVQKFRDTYNTFQKNFNVFPRLAFEGYTKLKGYIFKGREEFSVAKIGEGRIIAGFTERGNLTHIQMFDEE